MGVDIAFDTVQQDREVLGEYPPLSIVGGVRSLPFPAEMSDRIHYVRPTDQDGLAQGKTWPLSGLLG